MQTKYTFGVVTMLLLVSVWMISIESNEKAYSQSANTTGQMGGQMTNMTNATGVSSGTGENDDGGEVEEGQGEDQDEPGDIDKGDNED